VPQKRTILAFWQEILNKIAQITAFEKERPKHRWQKCIAGRNLCYSIRYFEGERFVSGWFFSDKILAKLSCWA